MRFFSKNAWDQGHKKCLGREGLRRNGHIKITFHHLFHPQS